MARLWRRSLSSTPRAANPQAPLAMAGATLLIACTAVTTLGCARTIERPSEAVAAPADDEEARVERFVKFERVRNADVRARLPDLRAYLLTLIDDAGGRAQDADERATDWYNAQRAAAMKRELEAARFSQQDVTWLSEAAQATYTERRLSEVLGGAQWDGAPRLAPRTATQTFPTDDPVLRKQREDLSRATRARQRYGDALVDALIRHEANLAPLLDAQREVDQQLIHAIDRWPPELSDAGP